MFLGQRCLETGVTEVSLLLRPEDMKKERMNTFIQSIQNTGLVLKEPDQYKPHNPYHVGAYHQKALQGKGPPVKPWSIVEEWYNVN